MKRVILGVLITAGLVFSQTFPWLDPANQSRTCGDTSGLVAKYEEYYRGTRQYQVYTTPADPSTGTGTSQQLYFSPVIDGLLEDKIWTYAETLLINGWEDAGAGSCTDNKFYGAQDVHAIWRFCYNHDGLYIGVEVHDDVFDVDSLKGWYAQDGVEFAIDPWDWGDFQAGKWSAGTNTFRRYWSDNGAIKPYSDGAHNAFFHILKRDVNEPYITGLIRGVHLANYGRGDEGTNFRLGDSRLQGIQFAVSKQGIDPWYRAVTHVEFKIPYHNSLWPELEGKGYFESNLPQSGILFKMDFQINDDDIPGPDGSSPNTVSLSRRRGVPFTQEQTGHDHWSDTKYFSTMRYAGSSTISKVRPYTNNEIHGDGRIAGIWVNGEALDAVRYSFTATGTVKFGETFYYFDSVTGTTPGGKLTTAGTEAGKYEFTASANGNRNRDKLKVTMGGTTYDLIRFLPLGYEALEARWVRATMQVSSIAGCAKPEFDTAWVPVAGAKEYRFCPLSKIVDSLVTDTRYKGCADSVRIYRYGTDSILGCYTYTYNQIIYGRDSQYCDIVIPTKFVKASVSGTPRNLLLKFPDKSVDTLVEIQPYGLSQFGETGQSRNMALVPTGLLPVNSPATLLKIRVIDKYRNFALLYPDPLATSKKIQTLFYPDMAMCRDSSQANYWSRMYPCSFRLDTLRLVGYDTTTKTATGLADKQSQTYWPDSSWVQQNCWLYINTGAGKSDSFLFRDTTRITWWKGELAAKPADLFNTISPYPCPSVEGPGDFGGDIRVLAVANYPNPFNPNTIIRFSIPAQPSIVHYALHIFNVQGQLVRTLEKGLVGGTGAVRRVLWDGTDNRGSSVSAGVYYYRLTVGDKVRKGNLVMVK